MTLKVVTMRLMSRWIGSLGFALANRSDTSLPYPKLTFIRGTGGDLAMVRSLINSDQSLRDHLAYSSDAHRLSRLGARTIMLQLNCAVIQPRVPPLRRSVAGTLT